MKVGVITDQHFGARGDNQVFDAYFEKFYDQFFFPTMVERGVKDLLILGDTFDRRKFINFVSLANCRRYFFDRLRDHGISVTMVVGNHDVFYKNTNDVNSPQLVLSDYENIRILTRPEVVQFDDVRIIMMPWICPDTFDESMHMIQNEPAECLFGHLELDGFEMYKGQPMHGGLSSHIFSRFELVCSGHFHTRSQVGNIRYLGSPYEMSWSDYDDPRGYHIFDTETRSMDFFKNPFRMFYKVFYNDENKKQPLRVDGQGEPNLKERYVKVIVENKSDSKLFEKILNKLYGMQPHEMKVIEVIEDITSTARSEGIDVEDTITLLDNYVDGMEIGLDKDRLKATLSSLYVEARTLEEEV